MLKNALELILSLQELTIEVDMGITILPNTLCAFCTHAAAGALQAYWFQLYSCLGRKGNVVRRHQIKLSM